MPAALEYYGYSGAVIISSMAAHYSIAKAIGLLGIGERHLLQVQVDVDDRMDLRALEETIAACRAKNWRILAIVGVAGSTEWPIVSNGAETNSKKDSNDRNYSIPVIMCTNHASKRSI